MAYCLLDYLVKDKNAKIAIIALYSSNKSKVVKTVMNTVSLIKGTTFTGNAIVPTKIPHDKTGDAYTVLPVFMKLFANQLIKYDNTVIKCTAVFLNVAADIIFNTEVGFINALTSVVEYPILGQSCPVQQNFLQFATDNFDPSSVKNITKHMWQGDLHILEGDFRCVKEQIKIMKEKDMDFSGMKPEDFIDTLGEETD